MKKTDRLKEVKAITDAPNLRDRAVNRCDGCKFFQEIPQPEGMHSWRGICSQFEFETQEDWVCDAFEAIPAPDPTQIAQVASAMMDAAGAMQDKSLDTLVAFGGAVKASPGGKVGGMLVRFSKAGDYDLVADRFDATTDFGLGELATLPVLYHHGLDAKIGKRRIGTAQTKIDNVGLWVEAQLNLRDEYEKQVYALAQAGKLGWSSGAAAHTVERVTEGKGAHIAQWFIAEASLTPIPAEPRNTVIALKSLMALPIGDAEGTAHPATQTASMNTTSEITHEVKQMDEKELIALLDKRDAEKATALKAAQDAEAAQKAAKEAQDATVKTAVAEALKGIVVTNGAGVKTFNTKSVTELGFANDEMKSFLHWIRTGDDVAYKAAMQGQTDSEGGYAVPDDFHNQVVAKRNEVSVARMCGVQVLGTSLDRLLVPIEDAAATKFVVTAEEGSYSENEPTLNQVAITLHKLTKLIKISEELEADAKANFGGYLAGVWGRTLALAENYYFFNVAANGSSQPQSVTYAATATSAVASQTATTAAELLSAIYAIPSAYSDKLVMVMRRATLGAFRALTGNPFAFIPTPQGSGDANTAPGLAGYIHNIPVYCTDELPAQAAANRPIVIFNPDFYAIVEREGLTVSRNPYLYQASGQIGLFARAREGGAMLQAEAGVYVLSKT